MIVTEGGKNVYPEEIEDSFQLIDDVQQVTVRGYHTDEDKTSELIEALIYPSDSLYEKLGCERNNQFVQDEVMEEIKNSLEKDSELYKIVYHRYLGTFFHEIPGIS